MSPSASSAVPSEGESANPISITEESAPKSEEAPVISEAKSSEEPIIKESSEEPVVEESSEVTPAVPEESESEPSIDPEQLVNSLVEEYGEFSITPDSTEGASVTYDEENNVYTLAVCTDKAEYVVKGAKATHIDVKDVNGLGSYKGVKITFEGAAIVSTDDRPAVDYTLGSKNVQFSAKKGTNNKIYSLGEGDGIHSENNVEVSGKGNLFIQTAKEHGIKAENKITLYGSNEIDIVAGHDALHAKKLLTVEDVEVDPAVFSGKVIVESAGHQGVDATTKNGDGSISIDGGTWEINNCKSAFKTDASLFIGEGATVTATNLSSYPVAYGDYATNLNVSVEGTFTVDGEAYESRDIWIDRVD